eukprot:7897181-Pyramimonas_sp.AAC.1
MSSAAATTSAPTRGLALRHGQEVGEVDARCRGLRRPRGIGDQLLVPPATDRGLQPRGGAQADRRPRRQAPWGDLQRQQGSRDAHRF